MAQKTAWTGFNISESDINTYLMHEGGAWTTWTPTLTQSGAVTKTVTRASYARIGRTIIGNLLLSCTGAGTAANPILVGFPVAAVGSNNVPVGSGAVYDSSVLTMYPGVAVFNSSTTMGIFGRTTAGALLGQGDMTAALASGDQVFISFMYEAVT